MLIKCPGVGVAIPMALGPVGVVPPGVINEGVIGVIGVCGVWFPDGVVPPGVI